MDMPPRKTREEFAREVARKHRRYDAEAYLLVLDAMPPRKEVPVNLTGQQLSRAIGDLAKDRFGLLARTVLESWGVRATSDFGEIVYHLIDEAALSKTAEDRKEDFDDVFDFHEAFDLGYFKPTEK